MATENDRSRLVTLINDTIQHLRRSANLYGFMPMEGTKYQRGQGLMVVGRAIAKGGWGPSSPLITSVATPEIILRFVDKLYHWGKSDPTGDEMGWINAYWGNPRRSENGDKNYNPATSAFWRVVKRVLVDVDSAAKNDPDQWARHLVWTDLYKLSAHGNPTGKLESGQRPRCIRALRAELDEYAPSKVLFLTGLGWAKPFLDEISHTSVDLPMTSPLEAAGQIQLSNGGTCTFVVAPHPQGKHEDPIVEQAVMALV